jgi:phosphatidylserine decarboxylase
MVKEGYYFGVPPLLLAVACYLAHWTAAAVVLLLLALFCLAFFRDPERVIPVDAGAIVSPADGRVVVVTAEAHAGRPGTRISIFLAIWNVHVNRSPAAGTITNFEYQPGRFLAAMRAEASAQNEQNIFTLAAADPANEAGGSAQKAATQEIVFKQIAGYVARRVVAWKKPGDTVARGERIGLVRFGSRADVWLPLGSRVLVKPGEHVAGGSSILGFLPGTSENVADDRGAQQSVGHQTPAAPAANHSDAHLTAAGQPKR